MIDLYDITIEELDARIAANRAEAADYVGRRCSGACDLGSAIRRNNEAWVLLEQVRHERTGIDPAPYRMSF